MADVDVFAIDEVIDLYRIDPAEFVEARAALVKELRAAKRADEAKAVVKLRKPTAAAWALDQVAAEQPELIEAALAAGEALQAATTETLEGDRSNLRAATEAEQRASAAVLDAAAGHAALTVDHREKAAASLRAAIGDEAVRAELLAGVLAADHEPPAMGFTAAAAAAELDEAPSKKAPAKKAPAKTVGRKPSAKAQLAAVPDEERPARAKRKIRRVGTPSSAKRQPVDEVDARRRAKEVERLQAEEAERRRAEAERAKERKRQQAALDAAKAEETAATRRTEADAAIAEAEQAEAAAAAGPPE